MQIQYLGFQLKARGRDYNYRVISPQAESREFTLTISNQAFLEQHFPYQDAPDICYQKLQRALEAETSEQQFPRHATLTTRELDEYREKYRPAKKTRY